jgi:hypothetical protein
VNTIMNLFVFIKWGGGCLEFLSNYWLVSKGSDPGSKSVENSKKSMWT